MVNESIKAMVDAYEYTFTDEVWEGKHKTLWPLLEEDSPRNDYYRKVMRKLRAAFDIEITNLRRLMDENSDRQREIIVLREALFAGTSIEESRKSVEATETTVQQGYNIKLLTLVNIFFLPLTFVTSIFGMENMPNKADKDPFAITTVTVCIPFLLLIGSLNTHKGMAFWRKRTKAVVDSVVEFFAWITGGSKKQPELVSAKSFDSEMSNGSLRRWSTGQKGVRHVETEESAAEEIRQRRLEGGLTTSVTFGPDVRPTTAERTSRIADMWIDERKTGRRKSRYSEEV